MVAYGALAFAIGSLLPLLTKTRPLWLLAAILSIAFVVGGKGVLSGLYVSWWNRSLMVSILVACIAGALRQHEKNKDKNSNNDIDGDS